jgi:hypothetical protein
MGFSWGIDVNLAQTRRELVDARRALAATEQALADVRARAAGAERSGDDARAELARYRSVILDYLEGVSDGKRFGALLALVYPPHPDVLDADREGA